MNDEEQKELIKHLLDMLKGIYQEQIAYQAFFEYVKSTATSIDADDILNQARLDPECKSQTDAYFRDYDEFVRLSDGQHDTDRRQALLLALFDRWKPTEKPN